jgi:hypothetical protein
VSTWLFFTVKLVHVLAMALWLGGPPVAVFGARRDLNAGLDLAKSTVERLLAITPLFIASALVTILSGALLVVFAGGISHVPARVLIGAALVVPIFAVGGAMNRPALMKLRDHFATGAEPAAAEHLVRRFLLAHRIEQALRLTVLALMVLPL